MSSNSGFFDALHPTGRSNTSGRSNSAVRSRTRRLISFTDDDNPHDGVLGSKQQSSGISSTFSSELTPPRSRGATPSPYASRGASPLPMRHPSRATESLNRAGQGGEGASSGGLGFTSSKPLNFAESSRAAVDLLDASWSSLQSLASSVLGSDIGRTSNGTAKTHTRRKPSRSDSYKRSTPRSSNPSSWGPSGLAPVDIGAGTKEERQALLQAKKREALLLADSELTANMKARHKRRDSSDQPGYSVLDPDQDEDALVYIHHVQAADSITGVTIRYGCQPAVFRKANGFWPSDSIQSRKTVLLPVDSCSVKGRPIRHSGNVDLLSNDHPGFDSSEDLNGSSIAPVAVFSHTDTSPEDGASTSTKTETEGDRTWKHESWVQIEGFPAAVEIGRVPRRTLGFFPRSRRKSIPYSDAEPPSTSSRESPTPSASSELRSSHVASPRNRPYPDPSDRGLSNTKPGARHQRQRSGFQLTGTGVGTLDRSSTAPGPAADGLNKFFAQHLPNLAPTPPAPNQLPNYDTASTALSSTPTGLDNLGGVLEGWVRKVATRAKAGLSELQQGTQPAQVNGRGPTPGLGGTGDLIEMDDALDPARDHSLPAPADPRRRPDQARSGSSFQPFSRPSASLTSRTRPAGSGQGDRFKDD